MKTKEKFLKFIFLFIVTIFLSLLFSANSTTYAAEIKITGTVVDETGSPIEGIEVEFDGNTCLTNSSGNYEVKGKDGEVKYNFKNGLEYEYYKDAVSTIYTPKVEKKNTKYNLVIVKPENGSESEYQEIEQIMSECKIGTKEIFTYKDGVFYDSTGNVTPNPYKRYMEIFDQASKNLFIALGNSDMPDIEIPSPGSGSSWKGNIFYNSGMHTKNWAQQASIMEQLKEMIYEFAGIETSEETLDTLVNNDYAEVDLSKGDKDKNQSIKLTLKRKEKPALIGDFITGTVYLEDGTREKITEDEYGKDLNNIKVKLIKIDGEIWETTINSEGQYGFERPAEDGIYKLEFTYNGQEFKTIDGEINNSNIEIEGNTDNHAKETNREEFNEKFKPIDNKTAKQISKWYSDDNIDIVNITAYTDEFEIKDIPAEGTEAEPDYKPAIPANPKYLNLVLEKREEFEITLEKSIEIVKVTLADGQVYQENIANDSPDDDVAEQVQLRQVIMDEELMHGATIEIEYLITAEFPNEAIKNKFAIDEIKIIDYLDYTNNKLEYNPKFKLLSTGEENQSLGWEIVENKDDLKINYGDCIEEKLANDNPDDGELEDRQYLIGTLKQNSEGNYETRLAVSKLISSSLENEELIYSNSAEIILYKNSEGRRMKWALEGNEEDKNISGNFNPGNIDDKGEDTGVAEDVFIIPPFGRNNKFFTNYIKYIEQKNDFLYKEEVK